jgi:hypothetical protein
VGKIEATGSRPGEVQRLDQLQGLIHFPLGDAICNRIGSKLWWVGLLSSVVVFISIFSLLFPLEVAVSRRVV